MQRILSGVVAVAVLMSPFFAGAQASRVPAVVNPSGTGVVIPAHAIEVAPNVFSLGESVDEKSGKKVEGYMIVHKAKDKAPQAKPGGAGGGKTTQCYAFIASGAKWKTIEPWVINPTNTFGLGSSTVFNIMDTAITLWESAADGAVGGGSLNILGTGSVTAMALVADETTTDGVNEIFFGDLGSGTIGVTILWGVFGGPVGGRQLLEWDQVYNTDYIWAADGSADKMDFQNIATHELGHTFGLADLYTSSCSNETMYGYGTEGEIKKQTLHPGDILGISTLY